MQGGAAGAVDDAKETDMSDGETLCLGSGVGQLGFKFYSPIKYLCDHEQIIPTLCA